MSQRTGRIANAVLALAGLTAGFGGMALRTHYQTPALKQNPHLRAHGLKLGTPASRTIDKTALPPGILLVEAEDGVNASLLAEMAERQGATADQEIAVVFSASPERAWLVPLATLHILRAAAAELGGYTERDNGVLIVFRNGELVHANSIPAEGDYPETAAIIAPTDILERVDRDVAKYLVSRELGRFALGYERFSKRPHPVSTDSILSEQAIDAFATERAGQAAAIKYRAWKQQAEQDAGAESRSF